MDGVDDEDGCHSDDVASHFLLQFDPRERESIPAAGCSDESTVGGRRRASERKE